MKITRKQLRQVIKEEIARINEDLEDQGQDEQDSDPRKIRTLPPATDRATQEYVRLSQLNKISSISDQTIKTALGFILNNMEFRS